MSAEPEISPSTCPHDCPSTCAWEVERRSKTRIGKLRDGAIFDDTAIRVRPA